MDSSRKIFNDPIHGNIELHPLCVKIVDTPQFQRLRFIKQMGGVYFVYPGAAHNRFEHSIGVCHLAGRLVRALRDPKSGVDITPKEELCVEIAALCHDLGHGPFSHLFDRKVIPELQRKAKTSDKKWEHENGSVLMLNYMIEENDLKGEFKKHGITKEDIVFIEELIDGHDDTSSKEDRPEKKRFLYEIVSNKRNGIDVDKWDYFARDCKMLGIGSNFDHNRLIAFSRVINVDGKSQICYRDKEAANLYDMFHTRYLLHTRACKHKVTCIIEYMIAEALVLAGDIIVFPGLDKDKPCTMLKAIYDMKAYSLLNDSVINTILESSDERLRQSKDILDRVLRRDLYKFVGEKRFAGNPFKDENEVIVEMQKTFDNEDDMRNVDDFKKKFSIGVDVADMNYGKNKENPINFVKFYSKDDPDNAKPRDKDDVGLLLPEKFAEKLVRVYCKDPEADKDVKKIFDNWSTNTKSGTKKQKTAQ